MALPFDEDLFCVVRFLLLFLFFFTFSFFIYRIGVCPTLIICLICVWQFFIKHLIMYDIYCKKQLSRLHDANSRRLWPSATCVNSMEKPRMGFSLLRASLNLSFLLALSRNFSFLLFPSCSFFFFFVPSFTVLFPLATSRSFLSFSLPLATSHTPSLLLATSRSLSLRLVSSLSRSGFKHVLGDLLTDLWATRLPSS